MNLEGLKKSMKQQEGQRSVKKYIVLFILLVEFHYGFYSFSENIK